MATLYRLHRHQQSMPKRQLPLPRIDLIVDATAGHELLSFMDTFSGYNQISMDPDDQEKTSFIHKARNLLLSSNAVWAQECRSYLSEVSESDVPETDRHNNGVYIDDMLVKSTTAELHIAHLSEAFQILRNYNMKLNPAKCAFGVSAGKFPGFHSQPPRNRGKSRQNKGCARHAITIRNKGSPAFDRKDCCTEPIHIQGE